MGRGLNDRCILFFGDSFTNAAGDPEGCGWVGLLVAACWQAGLPLTAYNLGVRGESTLDLERRMAAESRPRLIADADNRLVLAVGANDVSLDETGAQPISAEESDGALLRVLDAAERMGMTTLVLGPGPAGVTDHDERSRELERRRARICGERGVRFVPILDELLNAEAWRSEAVANDGIHPRTQGYAALAGLILSAGFVEWLAAPPTSTAHQAPRPGSGRE